MMFNENKLKGPKGPRGFRGVRGKTGPKGMPFKPGSDPLYTYEIKRLTTSGEIAEDTVVFTTNFITVPIICISMNNTVSDDKIIYSINVFDVTTNGFTYTVTQKQNNDSTIETYFGTSTLSFYYFAYGQI